MIVQCPTCSYLTHADICSKCRHSVVTDEMVDRATHALIASCDDGPYDPAEIEQETFEAWARLARIALTSAFNEERER